MSKDIHISSSRFKPYETVYFDPAVTGPNGAKLVSYRWSYEWIEDWNQSAGETISKRISDWTQSEISDDTGRQLVHVYGVQLPEGKTITASSESVPHLMGYMESKGMKGLPSLSNAVKTLAKLRIRHQQINSLKKEYDRLRHEISFPEIKEGTYDDLDGFGKIRYDRDNPSKIWLMGNFSTANEDHTSPNGKINNEGIHYLKMRYEADRIKQAGFEKARGLISTLSDIENRIKRQERKISEITRQMNTEEKASKGMKIKKSSFKPMGMKYKSIRDIASIRVIDPDDKSKIITIQGDNLYSGVHYLKEGGTLDMKSFYIPKSRVLEVVMKDGTIQKDVQNGFHVDNSVKEEIQNVEYDRDMERGLIATLRDVREKYQKDKNSSNYNYIGVALGDPDLIAMLYDAFLQSRPTELIKEYILLYRELRPSSGIKLNARLFFQLYIGPDDVSTGIPYGTDVWKLIPEQFKTSEFKIKSVVYSDRIDIKDQTRVLKILDKVTKNDALRPVISKIRIDDGHVVATDTNILIHLLNSNKETGYININKIAKESDDKDNSYPDWRRVLPGNFKKETKKQKFDLSKLMEHLWALVENGLTSAPLDTVMIRTSENLFIGFFADILIKGLKSFMELGFKPSAMHYVSSSKAVIFTSADATLMGGGLDHNLLMVMPMFMSDTSQNYVYYDMEDNVVKTTPADALRENSKYTFEDGGYLFPESEMFASGGDIPVSDPDAIETRYYIHDLNTGTDRHSGKVAEEIVNIVKADAEDEGFQINSFEDAKSYLEQNGYMLEEMDSFALGGGLADNLTVHDIARIHSVPVEVIQRQLSKGIIIEMEHTDDLLIAEEIAMDHLTENPDYYTHLVVMEKNFKTGGRLGFEGLAKKVSDAYVGKPVPSRYRSKYGSIYSRKEADAVGRKVAGKIYREQQR